MNSQITGNHQAKKITPKKTSWVHDKILKISKASHTIQISSTQILTNMGRRDLINAIHELMHGYAQLACSKRKVNLKRVEFLKTTRNWVKKQLENNPEIKKHETKIFKRLGGSLTAFISLMEEAILCVSTPKETSKSKKQIFKKKWMQLVDNATTKHPPKPSIQNQPIQTHHMSPSQQKTPEIKSEVPKLNLDRLNEISNQNKPLTVPNRPHIPTETNQVFQTPRITQPKRTTTLGNWLRKTFTPRQKKKNTNQNEIQNIPKKRISSGQKKKRKQVKTSNITHPVLGLETLFNTLPKTSPRTVFTSKIRQNNHIERINIQLFAVSDQLCTLPSFPPVDFSAALEGKVKGLSTAEEQMLQKCVEAWKKTERDGIFDSENRQLKPGCIASKMLGNKFEGQVTQVLQNPTIIQNWLKQGCNLFGTLGDLAPSEDYNWGNEKAPIGRNIFISLMSKLLIVDLIQTEGQFKIKARSATHLNQIKPTPTQIESLTAKGSKLRTALRALTKDIAEYKLDKFENSNKLADLYLNWLDNLLMILNPEQNQSETSYHHLSENLEAIGFLKQCKQIILNA